MKLSGLLIITVVYTLIITATVDGPLHGRTSRALAAPELFPDELQIQLGVNGFAPAEVQHAAGTFGIAVENSNVEGEYTLTLRTADGLVVKEVQVQKGSAAFTVTLSSGEYTLTEASHPQWLCRITVH